MVCGLLYIMWSVEWYVRCCMVCGLLNGMWELYGMRAVVINVGCWI